MTYSRAVVYTIAGLISVLIGIMGNAFYKTDLFDGSRLNKPDPHWLGRTFFIGVGAVLLVVGIHHLLLEP